MDSALIEQLRQKYSQVAREAIQNEFSQLTVLGACCGEEAGDGSCCSTGHAHTETLPAGGCFGAALYPPAQLEVLPAISVAVSSGCGSPTSLAELALGETVLDLGCGGGIDVFLAAGLVERRRQGVRFGDDRADAGPGQVVSASRRLSQR